MDERILMPASDRAIAASAQRPPDPAAAPTASDVRLQRILKIVVIGLALLLFAGLAAIIWRVIYLASPASRQPAALAPTVGPAERLALPAGAEIRSISLSGNRLAVHYVAGARAGIAVFDLKLGRMVTDIAVEPKPGPASPAAP
jgi:hypothetical protein